MLEAKSVREWIRRQIVKSFKGANRGRDRSDLSIDFSFDVMDVIKGRDQE